jgi:predicted nucleic acid-binding protein
VATSRLAYPEARAALARRRREGGLSAEDARRAVSALHRDTRTFVIVELREEVARQAGELADKYPLRGCDAVHLASAIALGQLTGSLPAFMTFDPRQSNAALSEKLSV